MRFTWSLARRPARCRRRFNEMLALAGTCLNRVNSTCADRDWRSFPRAAATRLSAGGRGGCGRGSRRIPPRADRPADRCGLPLAKVRTAGRTLHRGDGVSGQRAVRVLGRCRCYETTDNPEVQHAQGLPRQAWGWRRPDSADGNGLAPHMVAACRIRHHWK